MSQAGAPGQYQPLPDPNVAENNIPVVGPPPIQVVARDLQHHDSYNTGGRINIVSLLCTLFGMVTSYYLMIRIDQTYKGEGLIDNNLLLVIIGSACGMVILHSQSIIVIAV